MTFDPTIAPFRLHLGAEGLMISGSKKVPDDQGVSYLFNRFTGWDEPPALTMQILKKPNDHGSTAGQGWQGERNLVIEGWVVVPGDDPDQIRAAVDRLFAAIPLEDEMLVVHEYGLVRHLYVRQGGQPTGDRIGRKAGANRVSKFSIQLVALEPARLSGDGTGPTKHYETLPGQIGSLQVETGDGLVPPHIITIGPCSGPSIMVGAQQISYEIDVPPGQELQLDFAATSAMLNGHYVGYAMRGSWPTLNRKTNTFIFEASSVGAGTTCAVDTYDSYP